ncbi:MAG TPA: DUF4190 domain-containing protein [Chitinolyticbacter sp.]|nr:DUF4190 domain-containing protein [Chitinolyticbacter sp.]
MSQDLPQQTGPEPVTAAQATPDATQVTTTAPGLGMMSLVCAALMYGLGALGGWMLVPPLLVAALVQGHLARKAARTDLNAQDRKLAMAGLVLAYITVAIALVAAIFLGWLLLNFSPNGWR